MSEGQVLEGFLCPVCHLDCSSGTRLLAHFEEQHGSEDSIGLQSFKDFLNKAKKKLLNEDEPERPLDQSSLGSKALLVSLGGQDEDQLDHGIHHYQGNNPWNWDAPPPGPSRSHLSFFKRLRSVRIDSFVAETNKLLIRLNKLLTDLPTDPVKRKAHERAIVSWADDDAVPLCPFCARSFSLARRRHHCRLCGGIMCHDCSLMLTVQSAKKLVVPLYEGRIDKSTKEEDSGSSSSGSGSNNDGGGGGMGAILMGLRRSNSQGSLNSLLSVVDPMKNEPHFRVCRHCMEMLDARNNQVEQRVSQPTLTLYYNKLIEYRQQLETLLPQYIQMSESLRYGELTHSLHDAEKCRVTLLKKGDNLNSMANRIKNLGMGDSTLKDSPGPRQQMLLRRIHSSNTQFLKEQILTLPKLPSQEELSMLRARRRKEMEARLIAEKEAARQAEARGTEILKRRDKDSPHSTSTLSSLVSPYSSPTHTSLGISSIATTQRKDFAEEVLADSGWGADASAHDVTETDEPLVQQMNIIRNYIRQAREAGRCENIPLLEENLKELQEEYRRQQKIFHT